MEFYIHQIKETAMGTKFAIVGSNLVVPYEEIKMNVCITSTIISTRLC